MKKLKDMEDESVDAVVTDPPAGISFMGKSWDSDKGGRDQWIAWLQEIMEECNRVLKPGAHIVVWALPRTSHWTRMAIDNANFEIRHIIDHVFASGFPKSQNVGKAYDKKLGNERVDLGKNQYASRSSNSQPYGQGETGANDERKLTKGTSQWEGYGTALKPAHEDWILARKPLSEKSIVENCIKHGTGALNITGTRIPIQDDEVQKQSTPPDASGDSVFYDKHGFFPDSLSCILGLSFSQLHDFFDSIFFVPYSYSISYTNLLHNLEGIDHTNCKQLLDGAYDYDHLEKRVSEYVHGSSQFSNFQFDYPILSHLYDEFVRMQADISLSVFPLNSDAQADILDSLNAEENNQLNDNNLLLFFVLALIAYELTSSNDLFNNLHNNYKTSKGESQEEYIPNDKNNVYGKGLGAGTQEQLQGRFPADVIVSGDALDDGEVTKGSGKSYNYSGTEYNVKGFIPNNKPQANSNFGDSGSKSRYFDLDAWAEKNGIFYCPKPGSRERGEENEHSTVKPLALMSWLITLVTKTGDTVLDPFMGSGTTGIAAKKLNRHFIGIELDQNYFAIAKKRIKEAKKTQKQVNILQYVGC